MGAGVILLGSLKENDLKIVRKTISKRIIDLFFFVPNFHLSGGNLFIICVLFICFIESK